VSKRAELRRQWRADRKNLKQRVKFWDWTPTLFDDVKRAIREARSKVVHVTLRGGGGERNHENSTSAIPNERSHDGNSSSVPAWVLVVALLVIGAVIIATLLITDAAEPVLLVTLPLL
jgi:hypothetical protein